MIITATPIHSACDVPGSVRLLALTVLPPDRAIDAAAVPVDRGASHGSAFRGSHVARSLQLSAPHHGTVGMTTGRMQSLQLVV